MRKQYRYLFLLLLLSGCINKAEEQQRELTYFDLKGYFEREVNRLNRENPLITKSVEVNDSTETRSIRISDWKKELSIFSESDINRISWKGVFKRSKDKDGETYSSDNEKVPVKILKVGRKDEKINTILIVVRNSNSLYTSEDSLFYYPDSLYMVKKSQNIKLLNEKKYQVRGKF